MRNEIVVGALFTAAAGLAWTLARMSALAEQRRPQRGASWARRDSGFALVELLVAIVVMGVIAGPLSGLLITTIRVADQAQRKAERVAVGVTAVSIAERVDLDDECTPTAYQAAADGRLSVPDGWSVTWTPDCRLDGVTLVRVVVVDGRGDSLELGGVRP